MSVRPLNIAELARALGLSQRTVWRLHAEGNLPKPVRIGHSVRWREKDIEAWVEADCRATDKRGGP